MSRNFLSFDTFCFDFDGLLVNTEHLHYESYLEMVKQENFELHWDFSTYLQYALTSTEALKTAVYDSVQGFFSYESDWFKLRAKKQKIYEKKLLSGQTQLLDGVLEFIQLLLDHNKQLCVVTNSPQSQINIIKNHLPLLQKIPVWITRENYQNPKPSPDGYKKALELLNPKKAIGFEDSLKGLLALKQTSIQPVLVKPSYYPCFEEEQDPGVWQYPSIKDLLKEL